MVVIDGVSDQRGAKRRRKEGVQAPALAEPTSQAVVATPSNPLIPQGQARRESVFDPRKRGGSGLAAPAGAPTTAFNAGSLSEATDLINQQAQTNFDSNRDIPSIGVQPVVAPTVAPVVEEIATESPLDRSARVKNEAEAKRQSLESGPARLTKAQDLAVIDADERAALGAIDDEITAEKDRLIDEQTDVFMEQDPGLSFFIANERAKKSIALQTKLPAKADKIDALTAQFSDPQYREQFFGAEIERAFNALGSVKDAKNFAIDVLAMPSREVQDQLKNLQRSQHPTLSDEQFEEKTAFNEGNEVIQARLEMMSAGDFKELEDKVLSGDATEDESLDYVTQSSDALADIKAGIDSIAKVDFSDNLIRKTMLQRYIDDPRTGGRVKDSLQRELDFVEKEDRRKNGEDFSGVIENLKARPDIFDKLDKGAQTDLIKAGYVPPLPTNGAGQLRLPDYETTEDLSITNQAMLDFALTRKESDAFKAIEDDNKYELAEQMRSDFRGKVSQYDDYFDTFMTYTKKGVGVSDQDMQFIIRPLQNAMLRGDTKAVKRLTRAAILGVGDKTSDWQSKNTIMTLLSNFRSKAKELQAKGVDTGIFSGNAEKVVQKLGESTNPELAELGTLADIILIDYIKDTSGTAVTDKERSVLKAMLPSIVRGDDLNDSKIKGFMSSLRIKRDQPLKELLGDEKFDDLFSDEFNDGGWLEGSSDEGKRLLEIQRRTGETLKSLEDSGTNVDEIDLSTAIFASEIRELGLDPTAFKNGVGLEEQIEFGSHYNRNPEQIKSFIDAGGTINDIIDYFREKNLDTDEDSNSLEIGSQNWEGAPRQGDSRNDSGFISGVEKLAREVGVSGEDIMTVIGIETAGTFDPAIKNPKGSATGFIQFIDSTAKGLGTTPRDLAKMSPADQLQFVGKYFENKKANIDGVGDLYLAVAAPAFLGRADDTIVYKEGSQAWLDNAGWRDKDGLITVASIKASAERQKGRFS